jgi:hypothetical protein
MVLSRYSCVVLVVDQITKTKVLTVKINVRKE